MSYLTFAFMYFRIIINYVYNNTYYIVTILLGVTKAKVTRIPLSRILIHIAS